MMKNMFLPCVLALAFVVAGKSTATAGSLSTTVMYGSNQTKAMSGLAKDNFNRADTAWQTSNSTTHDIGADWVITSQNWKISGNSVTMQRDAVTPGTGLLYSNVTLTADTGVYSFSINGTIRLGTAASSDWVGLAFHIVNNTNYYALRYAGTGVVQLLRITNGAPAVQASASFAHVAGNAYRLSVSSVAAGQFAWQIVDVASGTTVAGATTTETGTGFTDGRGGFFTNSNLAQMDDFRLQVDETLAVSKKIKGTPVLKQGAGAIPQDSFSTNIDDSAPGFGVDTGTKQEFARAGDNGISLLFLRGAAISTSNFTVNQTSLSAGISALLEDTPNAQIVISIGGLHPPGAWYSAHSGCHLRDASGVESGFPDPNSPTYRAAALAYVRGIVQYIETQTTFSGNIAGYQVSVFEGGEFVMPTGYWCYSPSTAPAFQAWLQEQYGTIGNLRSAWGDPTIAGFSSVTVPTVADFTAADWGGFRNPQIRRKVSDFSAFWQEGDARLVVDLCHEIKSASILAKKPLTGAFYGYILETQQSNAKGHHALRTVLDSPDIDFLAAPYSYVYRCPAWLQKPEADADIGAGAYHGPADSIMTNGKLFFTEDDSRTYLTGAEDDNAHFMTPSGTIQNLRRNQIINACHGSGIWRLDLFRTGWYNSDPLMVELGTEKHLTAALLADSAYTGPGYTPDIAVIIDEESTFNVASKSDTDSSARLRIDMFLRDSLQRTGASYGVYLMSDLVAGRVPNCAAYIFAGTYMVTRSERAWIDENLKKSNKTLVWFYGSGLYDETGWGLDKMESLTGFDLAESAATTTPATIASAGAMIPYTTETNTTVIGGQPEWYVATVPGGAQTLGNYVHGGTQLPAVVFADMGSWNSVYVGSLSLTKKWAQSLVKLTGVHRYVETDATVPCYAGRGIVGIWGTEAMSGTVKLKSASDVYDLYTGALVGSNVTQFPVSVAQWQAKAFKIRTPGSAAWVP